MQLVTRERVLVILLRVVRPVHRAGAEQAESQQRVSRESAESQQRVSSEERRDAEARDRDREHDRWRVGQAGQAATGRAQGARSQC